MSWFAILLGWLLGASLVGAEWHAGTMATLLTWEPRRVRVLAAKLVAAGALAFTLGGGVAAPARGRAATGGAATRDHPRHRWRLDAVAVRRRAAGRGRLPGWGPDRLLNRRHQPQHRRRPWIAFGYFAIFENAIRGLRPRWTPWLLGDNLAVVITNQPQTFPLVDRSTLGAATLVGCYTLTLLVAAVASFRRRDIT